MYRQVSYPSLLLSTSTTFSPHTLPHRRAHCDVAGVTTTTGRANFYDHPRYCRQPRGLVNIITGVLFASFFYVRPEATAKRTCCTAPRSPQHRVCYSCYLLRAWPFSVKVCEVIRQAKHGLGPGENNTIIKDHFSSYLTSRVRGAMSTSSTSTPRYETSINKFVERHIDSATIDKSI